MAPLSSFNAQQVSSKLVLVLFFIILLIVPSSGTSRGYTTMQPEHHRKHYDAGSNSPGLFFSMLPKGKPVPPSGPSKRHNSVIEKNTLLSSPSQKINIPRRTLCYRHLRISRRAVDQEEHYVFGTRGIYVLDMKSVVKGLNKS
ncbi:hypothetical protein L1987_12141 [Smallanthus sonchifolius]|uniref:Uncharacterized protein n=1 Tax=Smallanthus sonchifolius TaxID=185202 RepID=A0ACB9JF32_9ASTR|nr:hypothetical protein L1987_12141 [Smallanthus sonchifolius]